MSPAADAPSDKRKGAWMMHPGALELKELLSELGRV
jgi:hypothetical protein